MPTETIDETEDWQVKVARELRSARNAADYYHGYSVLACSRAMIASPTHGQPYSPRLMELSDILQGCTDRATERALVMYGLARDEMNQNGREECGLFAAVKTMRQVQSDYAPHGDRMFAQSLRADVLTSVEQFIETGGAYYNGEPLENAGYLPLWRANGRTDEVNNLWTAWRRHIIGEVRLRLAMRAMMDDAITMESRAFAPVGSQHYAAEFLVAVLTESGHENNGDASSFLMLDPSALVNSWARGIVQEFDSYTEQFHTCSCGNVEDLSGEARNVACFLYNGDFVCSDCENDTARCNTCDEVYWADDTYCDPSGETICDGCRSEHILNCDNCGEDYWTDNSECFNCGWSPESGSSDSYGELYIHSYSYKPEPRFHWIASGGLIPDGQLEAGWAPPDSAGCDHGIFMGVEMETNCPGGADRTEGGNAITAAPVFREHGFIYAKSDCTVSGPEIVSHPATLDAHRQLWATFPWRELAVEYGWTGWRGANAGIHIHISRTAFKRESHLARFQMFFGNWRDELVAFCGRNDASYGCHGESMKGRAVAYAKGHRRPPRGSAINYEPRSTIEVRMFRSSLRPTTLAAYLEFCHALVMYSAEKRSNDMLNDNAADFNAFVAWMTDNGNYTNAVARVAERLS